jgi:hypothetical protein
LDRGVTDRLFRLAGEFHYDAFRSAANGAREMKVGGGRCAARQHERGQGSELLVQMIDVAFQPLDLARQYPQAFRLALALGHGKVGAEIEQVVLDQAEHRVELARLAKMQAHHADRRIGLVDGSVSRDAQIVFRTALASPERRGAVIAGPRIDAIEHDHWRPPDFS